MLGLAKAARGKRRGYLMRRRKTDFSQAVPHEVTKHGLRQSLEWTVSELRTTLRAVQGLSATTRPELPSLADVVPERDLAEVRRRSVSGYTAALATSSGKTRQLPFSSDQARPEEDARIPQDYSRDSHLSLQDTALPPIMSPNELKRSRTNENVSASSTHSYNSGGFIPQSPMQLNVTNECFLHRQVRSIVQPVSLLHPSSRQLAKQHMHRIYRTPASDFD